MAQLDVIVIGGSAGSLQSITTIVSALPADFAATVLIAVHTRTDGNGYLPRILARTTTLPVMFAANGMPIRKGQILVAPPDLHMLVGSRGIILSHGPRENGFRPAIDPLFRSAAQVYRSRVMGIILSGALDDGTYGLQTVKAAGGVTVAQNPDEARFPSMPLSAISNVEIDHIATAEEIAALILKSAGDAAERGPAMAKRREPEAQIPIVDSDVQDMQQEFGPPSALTCPDCGGALWELANDQLVRYRCHVGHQYSQNALDAHQRKAVETALWCAVRVLEEHAELRTRMGRRAAAAGMASVSSGFAQSAAQSQQQAQTLRELLFGQPPVAMSATPARPRRRKAGPRLARKRRRAA